MNTTLFVSELMFACIYSIAFVVFWELYRRNDGWLRIIMMGYMLAEIIVYLGSAIYFWMYYNQYTDLTIENLRLIILPSKAVSMLLLMYWIRKNDGL